jgi:hypothetical protein
MAQPPEGTLIYAMVARGTVVVAEHTSYTGNFRDIAAQCLHRLPAGNNRFTYTCDAHTFNFLVADGYGIYYHRCLSLAPGNMLTSALSTCFGSTLF